MVDKNGNKVEINFDIEPLKKEDTEGLVKLRRHHRSHSSDGSHHHHSKSSYKKKSGEANGKI